MGRDLGLGGRRPATIVALDDSLGDRELLRAALARSRPDVRVLAVGTAAEGLAAVRAYRPDAVVIDLDLPDTHGLDVVIDLRDDPATADLRLVILTGTDDPAARAAARTAGADAYVVKPLELDDLATAVVDACEL